MTGVRFWEPRSVEEAVALMRANPGAVPLAGGTDLVVHSRTRKSELPRELVNLGSIASLYGHSIDADGSLHLGGMVSHATIETLEEIRAGWPALADASSIVGSPATRNTGTVGGNLCNGSPAMELGAPLIAYGASVVLEGSEGARSVAIGEFLVGPARTARAADEILTEVVVPAASRWNGSAYLRLGFRRAMEIAIVGAAAAVRLGADGAVEDCRVALTAVAPTIVRATAAEDELRGRHPSPETVAKAAELAARQAHPIDDVRAPASYRLEMIPIITRRVIDLALGRASQTAHKRGPKG